MATGEDDAGTTDPAGRPPPLGTPLSADRRCCSSCSSCSLSTLFDFSVLFVVFHSSLCSFCHRGTFCSFFICLFYLSCLMFIMLAASIVHSVYSVNLNTLSFFRNLPVMIMFFLLSFYFSRVHHHIPFVHSIHIIHLRPWTTLPVPFTRERYRWLCGRDINDRCFGCTIGFYW